MIQRNKTTIVRDPMRSHPIHKQPKPTSHPQSRHLAVRDENTPYNTNVASEVNVGKTIKTFQQKTRPVEESLRYLLPSHHASAPIYSDWKLGFSSWSSITKKQKVDNDTDSDNEQINSGVRKLTEELMKACSEEPTMVSNTLKNTTASNNRLIDEEKRECITTSEFRLKD